MLSIDEAEYDVLRSLRNSSTYFLMLLSCNIAFLISDVKQLVRTFFFCFESESAWSCNFIIFGEVIFHVDSSLNLRYQFTTRAKRGFLARNVRF